MSDEEISLNFGDLKKSFNKTVDFFKQRKVIIISVLMILAALIAIGILIRVQNISLLKDQVTGQYIPLALDPFYWLREAASIVHTGSLPAVDSYRYAGPGVNIGSTSEIVPWVIAGLYKFLHLFNPSITLGYADIIYPVIFFALGAIAFYFLVEILTKSKLTALISSAFLIILPTYLYRTMAGFSDHNALGLFVFFVVLLVYAYSLVWINKENDERKSKVKKDLIINALLGLIVGFLTALDIVSWGGISQFIPMIIPFSFFLFWIIKTKDANKGKKEIPRFLAFYVSFIVFSVLSVMIFHNPISVALSRVITSSTSFLMGFVLLFAIFDFLIIKYGRKIPIKNLEKRHILWALIAAIVLGAVVVSTHYGLSSFVSSVLTRISHPFGATRLVSTVAEDAQTYTVNWISQTGPIFFWLFFSGVIAFGINFSRGIKSRKKRGWFVILWIFMISGLLLSRYSPNSSILNGGTFLSELFRFGSIILFILYSINLYAKDELDIPPEQFVLFAIMIVTLVAANTAAYVMTIVSPFTCIFAGYLIVSLGMWFKRTKKKDDLLKMTLVLLLIGVIIASVFSFSNLTRVSINEAKYTGPSATLQWQQAMAWVKNNTPQGSIFAHWWDYGYWVQYLGDRPTVADGGQYQQRYGGDEKIGRYILTTPDPATALSFFKSMNVSYFLIDPSDLGKYPAYSILGSNAAGTDRYSSLPIMPINQNQSMTQGNYTLRAYQSVAPTDQDILYNTSKGQILIPQGHAYVIGVLLNSTGGTGNQSLTFSQPHAVYYYNGQQFELPLRYLYFNNQLIDFKSGYPGAAYILPVLSQNGQSLQVNTMGSVIYLSPKVFSSFFAQLYLMNDPLNEYPTITVAHLQYDSLLQSLRSQGFNGEFVYYGGVGGFDGPIAIWNTTNIPDNINTIPKFYALWDGNYTSLDNATFKGNISGIVPFLNDTSYM